MDGPLFFNVIIVDFFAPCNNPAASITSAVEHEKAKRMRPAPAGQKAGLGADPPSTPRSLFNE
jgi:hypothetical protein